MGEKLNVRLLRRVPRFGAIKYFVAMGYITPKKLRNIVQCELDYRNGVAVPKSFPYIANFDVTNSCNLRCTYCPTGVMQKSGRRKYFMPLDQVRDAIDQLGDYLTIAYLYNWGEPLLHPEIAEIVNMLHQRGIFTSMSTNLSLKCEEQLLAVCDAGLDHLLLSLDGATQETYARYRKRGDLELALDNVRKLIQHRALHSRANPILEWQFLEFSFNVQEREKAQELARQLGVDKFLVRRGGALGEDKITEKEHKKDSFLVHAAKIIDDKLLGGIYAYRNNRTGFNPKFGCERLWRSVVLNGDGGVAPCCYVYKKENDFGDMNKESIPEIRKNDRYVVARKLFSERESAALPEDLLHTCLLCTVSDSYPHLKTRFEFNRQHYVENVASSGGSGGVSDSANAFQSDL